MADNPADPGFVRRLLQARGIRPLHRLGQNFLVDQPVLGRICDAIALNADDLVLEIGPGLGSLTAALAARAGRVVAVELDRTLLGVLQELLKAANVELLHGDALKADLAAILQERLPVGRRAKVAANLPYYITTPILMRLLEEDLPVSEAVVMVQLEVARRMVAAPATSDYGALSVAVQYYSEPRLVEQVQPSAFIPQPEVDSAVVHLRVRECPPVAADRQALFAVVRAAFGQRRKTLLNAVSAGLNQPRGVVAAAAAAAGIEAQRRGETLSLPEFAALTRELASLTAQG